MPRKPRTPKVVNPQVKTDLLDILVGIDDTTLVGIAEKFFKKDWVKELEDYFNKKNSVPVTPVKPPKNIKYKAMYEKLAKNIENMNAVVLKNKEEIGEE
jgi:hypothetical protein